MRASTPLLLAVLVLLLLPSTQLKKAGRGKGLRRGRHNQRQNRARAGGRHGRAGPSRRLAADCSEYNDSGDFFLDCQDRRLSSVPTATWAQDPDHLLLAQNRITALRDGAFSGFARLKSLDLQQNHISVVEEGAFLGLTRLTTLLLQHNQLGTLGEETLIPLPGLRYLRLYDNPWSCRCPLDSLVRTLQVPSNRNLGTHARCAEPVRLKGRKLKQVDPERLCPEPDSEDQQDPTDTLEPLPLRSKPDALASCHAYMFPKPRLDCRSRGLTEVPADIPADVVHVDLSHNSIRRLRARDFVGARSLRTLNLSRNTLEHIDTASLSGLLHLRELDLSNNSLSFFQYGVLEDLYFLSRLGLGGNPWACDYNIHYLVYWLHLHPVVRHSGLLCHSPPELSAVSVEKYVHSYNTGCPKDRHRSQTEPGQTEPGQTEPELWNTALELQAGVEEEEVEPAHYRGRPQKYQIIRLT